MTTKTKAPFKTEETNIASENMTLEDALKKIAELEAAVGEKEAIIDGVKKSQECFLVIAGNPTYKGKTAGVEFINGMAIIPYHEVYPLFVNDKQEKPSSLRMVEYLCSDFGYTFEFYDKDHQEELKKRVENRKSERASMEQKLEETGKMLEKLIQTHRFS